MEDRSSKKHKPKGRQMPTTRNNWYEKQPDFSDEILLEAIKRGQELVKKMYPQKISPRDATPHAPHIPRSKEHLLAH